MTFPGGSNVATDRQRSVIVLPVAESNGYTVGLDASTCIVLERVHADGTATRVTVTDVDGLIIALRRAHAAQTFDAEEST